MAEGEKTREELIAEQLDKPVDLRTLRSPNLGDTIQEELPEQKDDDTVTDPSDDDKGNKVRIPRSRLKTLTDKLDSYESRMAQMERDYQERIAALEKARSQPSDELPPEWVNLHGDSDASKALYRSTHELSRREFQAMLEQVERERTAKEAQQREVIQALEESFDEQMDSLEASLGRNLTDSQKEQIMEVVGKYSPRASDDPDRFSSYISIQSAYDIWKMGTKPNQAKEEIARIAGAPSSGTPGNGNSNMSIDDVRNWRSRYKHLGL